ncbi:MAG: radical SAM protein [Fusobacteriaceae bacterium]
MLIKITNSCGMVCKHCINDSKPGGSHMKFVDFQASIELAIKNNVQVIIIGGGEPTDHPGFYTFMDYLVENFKGVKIVVTHGYYLEEKPYDVATHKFQKYPDVLFQITNDKRYYPKSLSFQSEADVTGDFDNVKVFRELGGAIYPQGRALKYGKSLPQNPNVHQGTRCFNLRSISRSFLSNSLLDTIRELELRGKFCTPSISPDGFVGMGESNSCPPIGHVRTNVKELYENICTSQCNDCGMLNNLSQQHWDAIGFIPVE